MRCVSKHNIHHTCPTPPSPAACVCVCVCLCVCVCASDHAYVLMCEQLCLCMCCVYVCVCHIAPGKPTLAVYMLICQKEFMNSLIQHGHRQKAAAQYSL